MHLDILRYRASSGLSHSRSFSRDHGPAAPLYVAIEITLSEAAKALTLADSFLEAMVLHIFLIISLHISLPGFSLRGREIPAHPDQPSLCKGVE